MQDGKEEMLSHTVHITIAPMAAVDSTFTPSRRPSLVGDIHNPRRILSDSIVGGIAQPANAQRYVHYPPPLVKCMLKSLLQECCVVVLQRRLPLLR